MIYGIQKEMRSWRRKRYSDQVEVLIANEERIVVVRDIWQVIVGMDFMSNDTWRLWDNHRAFVEPSLGVSESMHANYFEQSLKMIYDSNDNVLNVYDKL